MVTLSRQELKALQEALVVTHTFETPVKENFEAYNTYGYYDDVEFCGIMGETPFYQHYTGDDEGDAAEHAKLLDVVIKDGIAHLSFTSTPGFVADTAEAGKLFDEHAAVADVMDRDAFIRFATEDGRQMEDVFTARLTALQAYIVPADLAVPKELTDALRLRDLSFTKVVADDHGKQYQVLVAIAED